MGNGVTCFNDPVLIRNSALGLYVAELLDSPYDPNCKGCAQGFGNVENRRKACQLRAIGHPCSERKHGKSGKYFPFLAIFFAVSG